jgi:exopolysaccharide biosynthesis polyprenyl glycosylphosphotransferase
LLRDHWRGFHRLLLGLEIVVSALLFGGLVLLLGRSQPGTAPGSDDFDTARLAVVWAIACLAWPLALRQLGLFASQRRRELADVLGRLTLAGGVGSVLVAAAAFATSAPLPYAFPFVYGAAQIVLLAPVRLGVLAALRRVRRRGRNYRNVLIVGSGPRARRLELDIERHPDWGLRIVGFVDDRQPPVDPDLPALEVYKPSELPDVFRREVIDEVIVACPRSMLSEIGPVVEACAVVGVPITVLSDLFGDYLPPPRVTRLDSMVALTFAPVHHGRGRLAVKRAIDLAGASVGLALSAPILAGAIALIRFTSPGPAFFRQVRAGLNGREFSMYKLRTMIAGAEERRGPLLHLNEMSGPVFKMRDDPRVTLVGRFLRRWSLDELPQLWNVLRGEMSLVGPRPPLPSEVRRYESFERRRLSMRPGITCLWQVSGRNEIGFDDWVKLDLRYIDTWSVRNDLLILARTIPAVLRGKGAS